MKDWDRFILADVSLSAWLGSGFVIQESELVKADAVVQFAHGCRVGRDQGVRLVSRHCQMACQCPEPWSVDKLLVSCLAT